MLKQKKLNTTTKYANNNNSINIKYTQKKTYISENTRYYEYKLEKK